MSDNEPASRTHPDLKTMREAMQELSAPSYNHDQALERFRRRQASRRGWLPAVTLAGATAVVLLLMLFTPQSSDPPVPALDPGVSQLTASREVLIPSMSELSSPPSSGLALPPRPSLNVSLSLSRLTETRLNEKSEV